MSYITVDQSFTNTAWVYWKDHQMIDFGVIHSDKSKTKYERAESIAQEMVKVVNKHKPDTMIVEQIAYGGIGNAAKDLAGLLFTIVIACKRATKLTYDDITFVTATGAKKAHTGNGRADKKMMLEHVPQSIIDEWVAASILKTKGMYDLADAYAFGVWYQNQ